MVLTDIFVLILGDMPFANINIMERQHWYHLLSCIFLNPLNVIHGKPLYIGRVFVAILLLQK